MAMILVHPTHALQSLSKAGTIARIMMVNCIDPGARRSSMWVGDRAGRMGSPCTPRQQLRSAMRWRAGQRRLGMAWVVID